MQPLLGRICRQGRNVVNPVNEVMQQFFQGLFPSSGYPAGKKEVVDQKKDPRRYQESDRNEIPGRGEQRRHYRYHYSDKKRQERNFPEISRLVAAHPEKESPPSLKSHTIRYYFCRLTAIRLGRDREDKRLDHHRDGARGRN